MKKLLGTILLLSGLLFPTYAQEVANRYEIDFAYNRTDLPTYNTVDNVENVNGFTLGSNVKVLGYKNGDLRVAYNLRRKLNQEVYPHYLGMMDLYRDVNTHSVGAEASFSIFFAGLFYGARKIHEDAPYQLVRYVRFGVKVPVTKRFFFKGSLDYEQPYGTLPMGFVNPYNRTLNFGGGFHFGK